MPTPTKRRKSYASPSSERRRRRQLLYDQMDQEDLLSDFQRDGEGGAEREGVEQNTGEDVNGCVQRELELVEKQKEHEDVEQIEESDFQRDGEGGVEREGVEQNTGEDVNGSAQQDLELVEKQKEHEDVEQIEDQIEVQDAGEESAVEKGMEDVEQIEEQNAREESADEEGMEDVEQIEEQDTGGEFADEKVLGQDVEQDEQVVEQGVDQNVGQDVEQDDDHSSGPDLPTEDDEQYEDDSSVQNIEVIEIDDSDSSEDEKPPSKIDGQNVSEEKDVVKIEEDIKIKNEDGSVSWSSTLKTRASSSGSSTPQQKNDNIPDNIPDFLTNLYTMLQDCFQDSLQKSDRVSSPNNQPIVSWSIPDENEPQNQGGGMKGIGKITFYNPDRFESKLLPKYFGSIRYSSFIRNMGAYGFKKRIHSKNKKLGKMVPFSYVNERLGREPESLFLLRKINSVGSSSSGSGSGSGSGIDAGALVASEEAKAEAYYNLHTIHHDEDLECNLSGVEPKLNMRLEIKDPDSIWSAAKIIKIEERKSEKDNNENESDSNNSSPKYDVTIRYEGWGYEWDEQLTYPNPRLARIFTYTKNVKCFVELFSKKNKKISTPTKRDTPPKKKRKKEIIPELKNLSELWPCTVSLRMPHPATHQSQQAERAEALLRLEPNVFIAPYAPELLPAYLKKRMTHGGWWLSGNKLRPWKDLDMENPVADDMNGCILRALPAVGLDEKSKSSGQSKVEYQFCKDFIIAYREALLDQWILGTLPPKVLAEGSLVVDGHRVKNVGGDAIKGVRYTGKFHSLELDSEEKKPESLASVAIPLSQDQLSTDPQNADDTEDVAMPDSISECPNPPPINIKIFPPPELPNPISVTNSFDALDGVRWLPHSNRWASIVRVQGNDVFLGSFVSRTEALQAKEMALLQARKENHDGKDEEFVLKEKDKNNDVENDNDDSYVASIPQIQHPQIQEQSTVESIGKITDLLSLPVESIVSAMEEQIYPREDDSQQCQQQSSQSGSRRQSLQRQQSTQSSQSIQSHTSLQTTQKHSFRLQEWVIQSYKHSRSTKEAAATESVARANDLPFIIGSVPSKATPSRKKRKQSTPRRLRVLPPPSSFIANTLFLLTLFAFVAVDAFFANHKGQCFGRSIVDESKMSLPLIFSQGSSTTSLNAAMDSLAMARSISPSVALIVPCGVRNVTTRGSGFVVDFPNQRNNEDAALNVLHVLTAAHVAAPGHSLRVSFPESGINPHTYNETEASDITYDAQVVGRDQAKDLALLRLKTQSPFPDVIRPLLLRSSNVTVETGTPVFCFGYPSGGVLGVAMTSGIVCASAKGLISPSTARSAQGSSAINDENSTSLPVFDISTTNFVVTDAAMAGGMSGGPLVDATTGMVVGINALINMELRALGNYAVDTATECVPFMTRLQMDQEREVETLRSNIAVVLYNDRFNKRERVSKLLQEVAQLTSEEAKKVMMEAHTRGQSVVQIFDEENEANILCNQLREEDLLVDLQTVKG